MLRDHLARTRTRHVKVADRFKSEMQIHERFKKHGGKRCSRENRSKLGIREGATEWLNVRQRIKSNGKVKSTRSILEKIIREMNKHEVRPPTPKSVIDVVDLT